MMRPGRAGGTFEHGLNRWRLAGGVVVLGLLAGAPGGVAGTGAELAPVVELEEEVYAYQPADNGAGPLWCAGSTCLVRLGDQLFASGLETLPDTPPLNNCRWVLFHRPSAGWTRLQHDTAGLTREPCPLVGFPEGPLFLSGNPTLVPGQYNGPARPEILAFDPRDPGAPPDRMIPEWNGNPPFTEHSYRSFAADPARRELILLQNIGYTHAEWTFRDPAGSWSARGELRWPWGEDYARPQPIRVCYPNVALKDRAVHFCGVSDIVEPNPEWRAFKRELTGREWDYDFRRLFYTWTPDIRTEPFRSWVEVASREATAGWIMPGDLWIDGTGTVHLTWSERALDERLRPRFFPDRRQSHAVQYAALRDGQVRRRLTVAIAEEGGSREVPSAPRFQPTPAGRLFVVYHVSGSDASGRRLVENRVAEILSSGTVGRPVSLPLEHPFSQFFTASERAGSPVSNVLEMLGQPAGGGTVIRYARVRLLPDP